MDRAEQLFHIAVEMGFVTVQYEWLGLKINSYCEVKMIGPDSETITIVGYGDSLRLAAMKSVK